MLQSYASRFRERTEKIRHKSTGFETTATRTDGFQSESQPRAFNNFIRVKNRRKIRLERQQQLCFPLWKRNLAKQPSQNGSLHPLLDSIEKLPTAKVNKRNTFHASEQQQKLFGRGKKKIEVADLRRSKTKYTNYEQPPKEWDRLTITKKSIDAQTTVKAQLQLAKSVKNSAKLFKKKSKQFKDIMNKESNQPKLENSLVTLISRFKFQNLRQSRMASDELSFKLIQPQESSRAASPFCSGFKDLKHSKKRDKMNKTVTKLGSMAQADCQKVARRACALTPWQMDNVELCSAYEIF